ncbi:MAG: fatty acid desaturase, partial [Cyanobacteria bacterium P01_A01_bin.3]
MTATTERPVSTPSYRLDDSTKLRDVIRSLPKEVFEKNSFKAWRSVAVTIAASIIGYAAIAFSPWYLLPLAWFFTGTALTGFFVIGHDCAHRSFAKKLWVNDAVGHLAMLPLIYPFHGWRIHHDTHHLYTNKLDVDNAWHPWSEDKYKDENFAVRRLYKGLRGAFWWIA